MKKLAKKLGGMTLVEVMVALAVFSIISAMLASAVAGVCSIVKKTDKLNKKIVNEAPAAELGKGEAVTDPATSKVESSMVLKIGSNEYKVIFNEYRTKDDSSNYDQAGDFKYFDAVGVATEPTSAPTP